jgi:hypothetical protein
MCAMSDTELSATEVTALRRLLDRNAIVECINRYARGIDRGDVELMGTAYHSDAVEDHGGGYVGAVDGLLPYLIETHKQFPGYQRFVTNFSIDIDGDEAHCESYWLTVLAMDDKAILNGGRYVDRLKKRDGEWGIVNRVVVIEWNGIAPGGIHKGSSQPALHDRNDVSYMRPLVVKADDTAASGA